MKLGPHLERMIVPVRISRRRLVLMLLVAFFAGVGFAVWTCALIIR